MLARIRAYFHNNILLISIVFLAFMLRVIAINKVPPSLNWDEISHGYNAFSILKTGRDQWGQVFPLVNFRAYGDYPLPLNMYLTIPSIIIFGLNEFSIRFSQAIFGTLTVFATYFLTLGLTKNKKLSLLVSLLVAMEPWYVFTSRIVLQQNLSVLLLTASVAMFVNRAKKRYLLIPSIIFLFLTLFSYHSTRIFSPLFLLGTLLIFRKELFTLFNKTSKKYKYCFLTVPAFLIVASVILLEPNARARSQWLFIINQSSVNKIIEARQNSNLPPDISRFIYNRPTYFVTQFTKNYFEYFSPKFLFYKGGTQYQYSLPNWGLSYLVNLPFFYLGVILLIVKFFQGKKNYQLILLWLVLSPVAGSITSEHYAVTRASLMLPLPQLISGLGLYSLLVFLKRKEVRIQLFVLSFYFLFLFMFSFKYLLDYFGNYSEKYSEAWQYGYKEVVNYLKMNYSDYDKIIITKKYGEPHEFILFFWPWDPERYLEDPNKISFNQTSWWWVDRFDKFYFMNDWNIPKEEWQPFKLESGGKFVCEAYSEEIKKLIEYDTESCLLVTSPGNAPKNWTKLETISFLDGKPAFEIYDNK